jgi:hemerythrin-like metal-binding protein
MESTAVDPPPAEEPAPPLHWTDNYVLGFAPMDETHQEFVERVAAVQTAGDEALLPAFDALAEHLKAHFAQEDQWMRETDFPPRDCHIDEHARVMESVVAVRARVAEGDLANGRRLAEALADWFPGHADYLDSALSHWMFKRRFGGKPVVIRREATAAGK